LLQYDKHLKADILSPPNAVFNTLSIKPEIPAENQNLGATMLATHVKPSQYGSVHLKIRLILKTTITYFTESRSNLHHLNAFTLQEVYPNLFNSTTITTLNPGTKMFFKLDVCNLLGR